MKRVSRSRTKTAFSDNPKRLKEKALNLVSPIFYNTAPKQESAAILECHRLSPNP